MCKNLHDSILLDILAIITIPILMIALFVVVCFLKFCELIGAKLEYYSDLITVPVLATAIVIIGMYFFNYKKQTWGFLVLAFSAFVWCGHDIYIGEWLQALRLFIGGMIGVVAYFHWRKPKDIKKHEPLNDKLNRWEQEGYAE